jgi:hypothetical protein
MGPTKLADFRDTVNAMSIKGSTDFLMTLIAMLDIFVVAFLSEMVVIASFNKSLPSANLAAPLPIMIVSHQTFGREWLWGYPFCQESLHNAVVLAEQMGVNSGSGSI